MQPSLLPLQSTLSGEHGSHEIAQTCAETFAPPDFFPHLDPYKIAHQSPFEEILNFLTHGFGFFASLFGVAVLVWTAFQSNIGTFAFLSCLIYGVSLVLVFAASTLYHLTNPSPAKRFFQLMDHVCIYLLIAGSLTPFATLALDGAWQWGSLTIMWTMAIGGIFFKVKSLGRYVRLSTFLYVLMGWSASLTMFPLFQVLSTWTLIWLVLGGLFYSIGTYFFLKDSMPLSHTIWHLFVLLGGGFHFFAVFNLVASC